MGPDWAADVAALCDPVFEAAAVGFTRQSMPPVQEHGVVGAILWEADPRQFAARYPDSGIVESYGEEQWSSVGCIDYWVYLDHPTGRCRLSVEGWNLPDLWLEMTGLSSVDGAAGADTFARILGVRSPRA